MDASDAATSVLRVPRPVKAAASVTPAPARPVLLEPSCSWYTLVLVCTAVAVMPTLAELMALTTAPRLPSPTATLAPEIVPARRPPESLHVMVPPVYEVSVAVPPEDAVVPVAVLRLSAFGVSSGA